MNEKLQQMKDLREQVWKSLADTSLDTVSLATKILDLIGAGLELYRISFYSLNEYSKNLQLLYQWNSQSGGKQLLGISILRDFLNNNNIQQLQNTKKHAQLFLKLREEDAASIMIVPFLCDEQRDTLIVYSAREKEFVWDHTVQNFIVDISCLLNMRLRQLTAEQKSQKSDEKYKEMANLLPQTVFELDVSGRFTFANKYGLDRFQYSEEEVLSGINLLQLFAPEYHDKVLRNFKAVLQGEKTIDHEYVAVNKSGERFPVLVYSNLIVHDNECIGLRGIVIDLTDQKKADEEVQKAQRIESIGLLAGGIAHDFNNRLSVIMGNAQLARLLAGPKTKIDKYLENIETSANQATELTQQLLTFSKGGEPVKKISDVSTIIVDSAKLSLSGTNEKCLFDIPKNLWAADVDRGQISQVINNLVINADQAMPDGGDITISAENIHLDNNQFGLVNGAYIKISIQDTGVGIPADKLNKIFDPYFTTKQKGSGLGLSVVYSIIKKHGGYITAESEYGEGALFTLYLPAVEKSISEIDKDDDAFQGSGTILVMDDDEQLLEMVGDMLESLGYNIIKSLEGGDAIEKYRNAFNENQNSIDAIIVDLTVPGGKGGKEMIKELLEINPHVKTIVSSGYSNAPIMSHYQEYGFVGVIAKPYKVDELSKVLHQAIHS